MLLLLLGMRFLLFLRILAYRQATVTHLFICHLQNSLSLGMAHLILSENTLRVCLILQPSFVASNRIFLGRC